RLVWAITQQERVAVAVAERDAVTAAAATQASTGPSAADLANREGTLRTAVAGIQRLLGGRVAAADAALSAAQEHLGGASAALAKSDAHAALPVSRQALADLDAARRALDPRLADLRQTLELPDHPASALDALAQSIQQITRDLRTPPDPARQAAVALRDQERQIAAEMRELAPQNAPLQNAAGAADQAADRMDRNQLLDAARQAQAALDLMKTAADFELQLPGITARQAEITQSLQRMLTQAATQAAPATAPEQPLDALPVSAAQAAQLAGDATYTQAQDRGAIPPTASQALATAEQALAEASAQAAAGNQPAAQAARHRALAALEQAQSVVAAAQSAQNALAAQQPKPNQPGLPQPGKNTQPGPTPPKPDQPPGPGQTLQGDPRDEHNQTVNITVSPVTGGTATFIQLPPRDRAAIEQSRHDPYPQEYAPLIENYFKNLSEQRE
ncbi:MAG TPA: hypothetical protein VHM90_00470, partial [Phycisphaerae bacterium]|nr:hypothetical protein [Phycisphaerae bacterium]